MPLYLGVTAFVLFVAGPALAYLAVLPPLLGFTLFLVAGIVGLAAAFAGTIQYRRSRLKRKLFGVAFGLPIILVIALSALRGIGHPRINDVSTDLHDPPAFRWVAELPAHEGADLSYPAEFVPVVREHYPELTSKRLPHPKVAVLDAMADIVGTQENTRIGRIDQKRGEIEGTASSMMFNFKDDFVIRVRSVRGGSVVDMRSRSRDGRGDLGVNAARIRAYLAALDERL